jgi:hypothetical protein
MDWTGFATLVAASAAAVLSAVSLLLSGRREDKRWKREVLEEAMVSLFDSSFNSPLTAAIAAREAGQDTEWHKARALDAHAVQMQALTRLRFLATPKVVDYAFQLHDVEDQLYEAAFREKGRFSAAQLQNLKDRRWSLRTELFNASRCNLGLRRSLPVRSSLHSGPTTEEIVNHEMKRQRFSEKSDRRRPFARRRAAVIVKVSRGEPLRRRQATAEARPRRQQPSTLP